MDIYSSGRLGANTCKPCVSNLSSGEFNVYGRIVTKRKKGCSHFYALLNTHAKRDGWKMCGIKLEDKIYNEGIDLECDEYEALTIVKLVYKTPY